MTLLEFLKHLNKLADVPLCFIRKWWRPVTCVGIAATMWTQGVIIPIITKTVPDLVGLAALITSIAAAFAVREWGKTKGVSDAND